MRVLTLFIKYSIMLAVFLLVSGVVAREVLLFVATQQVRQAINKMDLIIRSGTNTGAEYDTQCRSKNGGAGGVGSVELRFLNDQKFYIAVVCEYFKNDPVIAQQYTFVPFVKKVPGQAGLIWDPNGKSGFSVEVFGRKSSIILDGKKVLIKQGAIAETVNQPQSTCQGFGYACCSPEIEVGIGNVFSNVTDCPSSCFSQCVGRPSVLKFSADPGFDVKNRMVTTGKNVPLTFYFVTDPGVAKTATTTINYGDGKNDTFAESDGTTTHEYECLQAQCQYQATVSVTDDAGQTSAVVPIGTITVMVR